MGLFYLRTKDPELLAILIAHNRVHRGVAWLNKNAPIGWFRNFFTITSTGWTFRVNNSYDNECALALAFENVSWFTNSFGYVTEASVLWYTKRARHVRNFLRLNGFDQGTITSSKQTPVTNEHLNVAWQTCALRLCAAATIPHRHDSPLSDDRVEPQNHHLLERLRGWFTNRLRARNVPTAVVQRSMARLQ